MKKFILIDHEPWTIRRKQLFYDLFEKAGIQLYVWDLSEWLHPGFHNPDEIKDAFYLKKIKSEKDYVEALNLETSENTIIVEEVFRNWNNRRVFKHIFLHKFKTIKIELYGNTALKQKTANRILNIPFRRIPKIIKNRTQMLLNKYYNKLYNIGNPSRLLSSNSTQWLTDSINHPDYERYRFHEHPQIIEGDYIVFSDIYFPLHTDYIYFFKIKNLPDATKYQNKMKEYFDFLENKYNMPVIIAAHPKANYKGNEFGNRKIIKYKTDDLIAHANMVTMHVCNTISYVLLWNKPVAFIATDDYLKTNKEKAAMELLAKQTLGLTYYNLDRTTFKDIKFEKVNPQLRKNYIFNYLTSRESENINNEKAIRKMLEKM